MRDEATEQKKAEKRERWLKKQAAIKEKAEAGVEATAEDEAEADTDAEDVEEELDEETKAEQAYRGGRKSGLRKVRLGAFEDTGRCKG